MYNAGRTMLAMTASSGKKGVFNTVLAAVKNELAPIKVSYSLHLYDWLALYVRRDNHTCNSLLNLTIHIL